MVVYGKDIAIQGYFEIIVVPTYLWTNTCYGYIMGTGRKEYIEN